MSGIEAIASAVSSTAASALGGAALPHAMPAAAAPQASFGDILASGMRNAEAKIANANDLVRQFAVDDSVPLHQVTYALEEARLAVELAMQVRTRLVESYRELMNMQL